MGPGLTVEEQQIQAGMAFPGLVLNSALSYWRLGDPIPAQGVRFLIAIAPSYNLADLRFADLLNMELKARPRKDLVVHVLNLDDTQGHPLADYFPGLAGYPGTPVVGFWEDGRLVDIWRSGEAMNRVLQYFGIPTTAREVHESVCPPSPSLLEDTADG